MVRWLILLVSFGLWLACMAVVYVQYSPRESTISTPQTEAALDALFDEQAQPTHAWRIFIDLERLKGGKAVSGESGGSASNKTKSAWDGVSEVSLLRVGEIETTVKRKHTTRLEQNTTIAIRIPKGTGMTWLDSIDKVDYKSWADIGLDRGLEMFNSLFKFSGLNLEVSSLGSRDGDAINVTQNVYQDGKLLMHQSDRIPVSGKSAPGIELIPFQDNPNVRTGFTFDIVMLDTSVDPKGFAKPRMLTMKATCAAPKLIVQNGVKTPAFEASTEDGSARAWYSADGIVLKQEFLIAGVLEIMLVKIQPKELRHRD